MPNIKSHYTPPSSRWRAGFSDEELVEALRDYLAKRGESAPAGRKTFCLLRRDDGYRPSYGIEAAVELIVDS